MTIGIDISPACRKQKTGIEWYAWHITKGILRHLHGRAEFVLYTDTKSDEAFEEDVRLLSWRSKYFWPELRLSAELWYRKPDVLFVPSRALPLVLPKKTVTTIHDVGFIPYAEERKRLSREYLLMTSRRAARRADEIITVSEFSKNEIVRYFNVSPDKITVTYLGYDNQRYVPRAFDVPPGKPTILFVGRRERRKNIIMLVEAYERLVERLKGNAPDLVLVGPPGHHAVEIDRAIRESPVRRSVHIRNWISEEEKIVLMQSAAVYVQPSLYEGFGLPVIEAQGCGIPVVCSAIPVLSEIAGGSASFVDPTDPDQWAVAMEKMLTDKELRAATRETGLQNAKRFSWERTSAQTAELLFKM